MNTSCVNSNGVHVTSVDANQYQLLFKYKTLATVWCKAFLPGDEIWVDITNPSNCLKILEPRNIILCCRQKSVFTGMKASLSWNKWRTTKKVKYHVCLFVFSDVVLSVRWLTSQSCTCRQLSFTWSFHLVLNSFS